MKTGVLSMGVLVLMALDAASAAFQHQSYRGQSFGAGPQQRFQQGFQRPGFQGQQRLPSTPFPAQNRFQHGNQQGFRQGYQQGYQQQHPNYQHGYQHNYQGNFQGNYPPTTPYPNNNRYQTPYPIASASSFHASYPTTRYNTLFQSRRRYSGRQPSSLSAQVAGASQEQRYQAQLATRRQLEQQRRQEQTLLRSGFGTVRPGSPAAALANEKRADDKSLALGQQALSQILYLQNLVGTGRR